MLATLLGPPDVVVGVDPPQAANAVAATSPSTGIRAFITNLPVAALLRLSRIVIRGNFERSRAAYAASPIIVAMNRRRLALAALALGLLGSQAGHLLAYQLRFGAAAQQIQSTGAHAYFPMVAKTAVGAVAVALIGGLLLVGLARILSGRRVRSDSEPSYVSLLAILFSLQLATFAAQEIAEAIVAGTSIGSAADLLLWGTLGQLPVAVVAASVLRWLSARVESAVGLIREVVAASLRVAPAPAPVAIAAYVAPDVALLMSRVAGSSLAKRGPPSSLPIAS
jgi:hypothetical protein